MATVEHVSTTTTDGSVRGTAAGWAAVDSGELQVSNDAAAADAGDGGCQQRERSTAVVDGGHSASSAAGVSTDQRITATSR